MYLHPQNHSGHHPNLKHVTPRCETSLGCFLFHTPQLHSSKSFEIRGGNDGEGRWNRILRHLSLLHRLQNAGHSRNASSARRRGLPSDDVILLHDNAMPHSACVTQEFIDSLDWEQMNHSPYSPDLAPSDIHIFLHLKQFLSGQHFDGDKEVKEAVTSWLTRRRPPSMMLAYKTVFLHTINTLMC
ncbi:hypothetical protein AVEN_12471-1 [Araneus ventricosus]|uniref:Mariner Mos1 transposase n=1 Tax=Araneus ventricosus TaxID=182803 RepID=A0A4Y2IRR0_ARAVE|nr:hypothetical protein AVEN_12471-1 [Araneus ventricosus]